MSDEVRLPSRGEAFAVAFLICVAGVVGAHLVIDLYATSRRAVQLEGRVDFLAGEAACPHPAGSWEAMHWQAGYDKEAAKKRAKEPAGGR